MEFKRSSGVLLHPSSLPGRFGIGSLGKESFAFIDFLVDSKQTYWQLLPLGPTGYGDSPYQCFSSVAGNPNLIDLDTMVSDGFLKMEDLHDAPDFPEDQVDYSWINFYKKQKLQLAFTRFRNSSQEDSASYEDFLNANAFWLDEYALFTALKQHHKQVSWIDWAPEYRNRNEAKLTEFLRTHQNEIEYEKFIQFLFFDQWNRVKQYANSRGVQIIGDIPIYVSFDSVEAWTRPEIFQFDEDKKPIRVAGVPPDYFSETGQLWGNPVYNWDYLLDTNFDWWKERIRGNLKLYDVFRIDHFRGFAAYWAVPFGNETAIDGEWLRCPGKELFTALQSEFGELPIIAEDLGLITDDVLELRDQFGFPGMKILQFAFDSDEKNNYLPHTYHSHCVVYTGTHDNNTVLGWYEGTHEENHKNVENYLGGEPAEGISRALIRMSHASVADLSIIPLQDILELDASGRMNTPGTTEGNWKWRFRREAITNELAQWLKHITRTYDR